MHWAIRRGWIRRSGAADMVEKILRRIAESDVFVAIVSTHTLNSVACQRELEWALALNKPVLPVAVERLPQALPLTLSTRQIVDYSKPGEKAVRPGRCTGDLASGTTRT